MRDYPRITPILRQLVKSAPNGLPAKAVAELISCNYSTLLADVGERGNHKAGVELLLPLMDVTGSCLPLDVMAEAMDGFFVRMPSVAEGDCGEMTSQCLASVREFGNLMASVADALADDRPTREKRRPASPQGVLPGRPKARAFWRSLSCDAHSLRSGHDLDAQPGGRRPTP